MKKKETIEYPREYELVSGSREEVVTRGNKLMAKGYEPTGAPSASSMMSMHPFFGPDISQGFFLQAFVFKNKDRYHEFLKKEAEKKRAEEAEERKKEAEERKKEALQKRGRAYFAKRAELAVGQKVRVRWGRYARRKDFDGVVVQASNRHDYNSDPFYQDRPIRLTLTIKNTKTKRTTEGIHEPVVKDLKLPPATYDPKEK